MASKKSDPATKAKSPVPVSGDIVTKSEGSGGRTLNRMLIAAFVSGVIIVETLVFFFLVPSGEEVAALAEHRLIEKNTDHSKAITDGHGNAHGAEPAQKDMNRIVEYDLGSFNIAFIPAGADLPYRVEFRLFGELVAKDQAHLEEIFEERKGRFRHRMILEIRNASLQELQENQLGLIRRRILATSTELLGEPILINVGFNDYQVIED